MVEQNNINQDENKFLPTNYISNRILQLVCPFVQTIAACDD